ncbi:MAG: glycoside hydrolase family 10 protein [Phycisphaerae bacterium]
MQDHRPTSWRRWIALSLPGLVTLAAGCVTGPQVRQPMRAIWVTRWDYKTTDDVTRIIENCADAGFNVVLFQVRGNGTAFYDSTFEPWADELGGSDPGFDPLKLACREAHERGIELHAYVNVMPAWRGTEPPANPEQLYNKHPEWFWYDAEGNRQPLEHRVGGRQRAWYVSLNPCLPEVREYLVDVFCDLVSRYDVDGLHLDYIRFPNEPVVSGEKIPDYPRDERTLAVYKEETGLTPDHNPEAWNQWRTDCVTKVVADIHAMLRRTKPRAVLSAAVGSVRERALHHFQDARRWMDDGIIDVVFLMNYTDSPERFAERIDPWLEDEPEVPVVPGLWFGRHRDKSVEEAAAAVREQIEIAREKTGDFCVFTYSSLFDSADEELTAQNAEQRRVRQVRRQILLLFLKALAEEAG